MSKMTHNYTAHRPKGNETQNINSESQILYLETEKGILVLLLAFSYYLREQPVLCNLHIALKSLTGVGHI